MDAKELEDVERLMAYRDNSFLVTDERKRQDLLALADAVPGMFNHIKEQSRLLERAQADADHFKAEYNRVRGERDKAEKNFTDTMREKEVVDLQVESLRKAAQEKLDHDQSPHYGGRCAKCFAVDRDMAEALKGVVEKRHGLAPTEIKDLGHIDIRDGMED